MSRPIYIVATGVANLASVAASVQRLGREPVPTLDPERVEQCDTLILPGVGSFAAGMSALRDAELVGPLRRRIEADRTTVAVCLGLQLLARESAESPGVEGLGVLDSLVRPLAGPRTPQMGWNAVGGGAVEPGHYYFANSYALAAVPDDWEVSYAKFGEPFPAAVRRGNVVAAQFHPELSGDRGQEMLANAFANTNTASSTQLADRSLLATRIVPCMDIRDGRIVKGVKFQGLRDAGDPVRRARLYAERGADELVMLDVSATVEGRRARVGVIRAVRGEVAIPLTVGGGLRGVDDAAVVLEAGADKVSINSAAVRRPQLLGELAERFGRQCTVLAVDAMRREDGSGWDVVVRGGRERLDLDALEWMDRGTALGAGEVLLTSWDRDGTGEGYDVELLRAARERLDVPIIASGGASSPQHLVDAVHAGADAVLAASIFHDGVWNVDSLKSELKSRNLEIRT